MLSNGFDATLHLKLKPSKILLAIRFIAHSLALLAISLPLGINIEYKIVLYVFVLTSLFWTMLTHIKNKDRVSLFHWRHAQQWIESTSNDAGNEQVWLCQLGAMITPWFIIVILKKDTLKRSIFIGVDQCDGQTYRRLSVRLKYLTHIKSHSEKVSI